jgi:deoxycytidylate deaminase
MRPVYSLATVARNEPSPLSSIDYRDAEIVLGLVAPVGTDLEAVRARVRDHVKQFNYQLNPLRLSGFLDRLDPRSLRVALKQEPEYDRITTHMDAGNKLRVRAGRGDLLALYAVSEIHFGRKNTAEPLPATLHVLDSLKHPDEVTALRRIYGPGFFLIGVYSPEHERIDHLVNRRHLTRPQAQKLIARDEAEEESLGQQTRDTFFLADVFIRAGEKGASDLWRFLDLIFGHQFHTPTVDENAMFLAHAAALRSADLSRQVGAVILSEERELIATGANDVPSPGGGLYWPGPNDVRDHVRGFDSNKREIDEIVRDTLRRATERSRTRLDLDKALARLRPGRLFDLTEFGRAVHAEVESIIACARIGVSPRRGTMYVTTFPCHNCAKHIVAAGLSRVLYVEPYPKSRAIQLHPDSIRLTEKDDSPGEMAPSSGEHKQSGRKVDFTPFIGITARRYFDLFSMKLSTGSPIRRSRSGIKVEWDPAAAQPRVVMSPASYIQREKLAISELLQATDRGNRGRKKAKRRRQ